MSMDAVFRALADEGRRTLLDRLHARNGQTLNELAKRWTCRGKPSPNIWEFWRRPIWWSCNGAAARSFITSTPFPSTKSPSAGSANTSATGWPRWRRSNKRWKETTNEQGQAGLRHLYPQHAGEGVGRDHQPGSDQAILGTQQCVRVEARCDLGTSARQQFQRRCCRQGDRNLSAEAAGDQLGQSREPARSRQGFARDVRPRRHGRSRSP